MGNTEVGVFIKGTRVLHEIYGHGVAWCAIMGT